MKQKILCNALALFVALSVEIMLSTRAWSQDIRVEAKTFKKLATNYPVISCEHLQFREVQESQILKDYLALKDMGAKKHFEVIRALESLMPRAYLQAIKVEPLLMSAEIPWKKLHLDFKKAPFVMILRSHSMDMSVDDSPFFDSRSQIVKGEKALTVTTPVTLMDICAIGAVTLQLYSDCEVDDFEYYQCGPETNGVCPDVSVTDISSCQSVQNIRVNVKSLAEAIKPDLPRMGRSYP